MIDHFEFKTSDFDNAKYCYQELLKCLGISVSWSDDNAIAFLDPEKSHNFFLIQRSHVKSKGSPFHICFSAKSKLDVDSFHARAMEIGMLDFGSPGFRSSYGEGYYAAFVKDGEGNNIEALFRAT
ncbi:VOC family protein [Pseudobacteriovorax antillogorgiicola]|uniref:Glyoxalase/Bleomycin resistance protein/Dioxygenase superfamily protein n=1 Tax=Pseudobacteriovorax antillogorgiicola TaxID=1513793 RepID=A0A1Y6CUW4_9BACT|nr:VOC family protein [Pseudobacteriovorax antillogorgiicola]TCS43499.1 glyoxalase/bleomycin resistance protein/dioxygenase superfamily protein [Pseudobacteriovorax antillogorgiicola]SMF81153.1 Glyoxalase/Bleomycin resistance protein/Dioxygenase superfamily protein [Pseudobacteriovorax antillogorgiicola]